MILWHTGSLGDINPHIYIWLKRSEYGTRVRRLANILAEFLTGTRTIVPYIDKDIYNIIVKSIICSGDFRYGRRRTYDLLAIGPMSTRPRGQSVPD